MRAAGRAAVGRASGPAGERPGGTNLDFEVFLERAVEVSPGKRDQPRPRGPGFRSASRLVPESGINLDRVLPKYRGVEVVPGSPVRFLLPMGGHPDREMGIPFWLSFAFWQWMALAFLRLGIGYLALEADRRSHPSSPI